MIIDSTTAAALCRANYELGQRIGKLVLESQARWLQLGLSQIEAAFACTPHRAAAHATEYPACLPLAGDAAIWQTAWIWERTQASAVSMQNAFIADVEEALLAWRQECARLTATKPLLQRSAEGRA